MKLPCGSNSSSCAAAAAYAGPEVLPRERTEICPLEFTATPVASPRYRSFGILSGSDPVKGMTGTASCAKAGDASSMSKPMSGNFITSSSGNRVLARARHERHHGQELESQGIDEVGRVRRFQERPLDAVAQARLLVDVEVVAASEILDAAEDRVVRLPQLLGRFLRRYLHSGGRVPLDQIRDDRIGEFVDLSDFEPVTDHGGIARTNRRDYGIRARAGSCRRHEIGRAHV